MGEAIHRQRLDTGAGGFRQRYRVLVTTTGASMSNETIEHQKTEFLPWGSTGIVTVQELAELFGQYDASLLCRKPRLGQSSRYALWPSG